MRKRIFSTLFLWIGLIVVLSLFGVHGAVWIIAVAAFFTQFELYDMFQKMGYRPNWNSGLISGLAITLGSYYFGVSTYGNPNIEAGTDIFVFAVLIQCLIAVSSEKTEEHLTSFLPTLIGIVYIPFMMHFLVRLILKCELEGFGPTVALFLCIWVVAVAKFNDVGALLVGRVAGRHKLSPQLSPKKTWEGAIGGVTIAAAVGIALLYFDRALGTGFSPDSFSYLNAALMAIPIAVSGVASDLLESAFKRQAQVKDSGNSIPGIGGVFDLTDSIILAGPFAYLLYKITVFS